MKKYVLVMLMLVGVLMMSACNEKQSSAKDVKEDVEVINTPVEKEEESVDEVVEEEKVVVEATEDETAAVTLNYENTKDGVNTEVFKLLSNVNIALALQENSPFTLDVIKTWFVDFEHSNAQADIYLSKIKEQGVILSEENDGPRIFKKTEQVEGNVWNLEVEVLDTYQGKTATTMWYLMAQPNNEGKMTINISEIK